MVSLNNDGLLTQLGYPINDATLGKLKAVIQNTCGFSEIEKHILQLHDALGLHGSFVALSNSTDYFKIKNESKDKTTEEQIDGMIRKWAAKYKIALQNVDNKPTYYIIGKQ